TIIFVDMKINNIIIIFICILMFSFFLIVAGRNLPSPSSPNVNFDAPPVQPTLSPPPPNVNFDAPPVQPTLPPPSPIVNRGDVFNDIHGRMITLICLAVFITVVLFGQTVVLFVQICMGLQS
ncbi:hypothetical protein A2U01_0017133, partial [Trifolium medium]|nr:hypothetical protein [Trifolium medium]